MSHIHLVLVCTVGEVLVEQSLNLVVPIHTHHYIQPNKRVDLLEEQILELAKLGSIRSVALHLHHLLPQGVDPGKLRLQVLPQVIT